MKAVIFDIGGVFVDLGFAPMKQRFCQLGANDFDPGYQKLINSDDFRRFETGQVTQQAFRKNVRQALALAEQVDDAAIDDAWNGMIVDFPIGRLSVLKQAKALGLTIYCFSNNNPIHTHYIQQQFPQQWQMLIDHCSRCFLSYQVGYRKPSPSSFKRLLSEAGLTPSTTLFVDDKGSYVQGARDSGIEAFHLRLPEMNLQDDFLPWLIAQTECV